MQPKYDFASRKFNEIERVRGKNDDAKKYIQNNKPVHAFEMTFGEIAGVPNLDQTGNTHVEIRIFLFDNVRKIMASSVHIIKCCVKEKTALSSGWNIEEA